MTSRVVLPTKPAGTTQYIPTTGWDFTSLLQVGETISTAVVTASLWSGNFANPSSIISGSATHSGNIVMQLITGGLVGNIFELTCTITTSLGQTLALFGYLATVPDVP